VVIATAAGLFLVLPLLKGQPGITRENFERLQEGMTWQEVESILGGPAGDYTSGRKTPNLNSIKFFPPCFGGPITHQRVWIGENSAITVCFYVDGKVLWKDWLEVSGAGPTIWEYARSLLPGSSNIPVGAVTGSPTPFRINYKSTGGILGPKAKKIEQGALPGS
jgi:hypothetical protein